MGMKHIFARACAGAVFLSVLTVSAAPTASAGKSLLDADFESGLDGFGPRQSESVERTNTTAYSGDWSLLISNRNEAWNGAVMSMGSTWTAGKTYAFSCAMRQDSGATVTMQLSLQYSSGGDTAYAHIVKADVPSGEWTVLENNAYQIPSGASGMSLYVETIDSKCDFYVDCIKSEVPSVYRKGDINHDEKIDMTDVKTMLDFLLGKSPDAEIFMDTADLDGNKKINAADFTLLKRLFTSGEYTETTTTTTTTAPPAPPKDDWPELHPGDKWYNTADVSWIPAGKKTVALSFDDGPCPNGENYGMRIQQALNKQGFHATFFYWGERIAGHENEIIEAEKAGHEVANHTWTHPDNYHQMDSNGVLSQYTRVKDKLNEILGVKRDYLLRLPYLNISDTISRTLPVPFPNCGINTADYEPGHSAGQTVSQIQQAAQNGSLNGKVVLMHEVYDCTATAVEQLCPWLEQNGYVVCTVSEMFKYNGKDMYAGRKYDSCW